MEPVSLVIALAVGAGSMWWQYRKTRGDDGLEVLRRAEAEFRAIRISEAPAELCFDGRSAEIVHEQRYYEDEHQYRVVSVQRYARNAYGEYFFFVYEGAATPYAGRPYFKHIEQRAAKAALGKRYLAPPAGRRAPGQ